jgi:hypothetical protein
VTISPSVTPSGNELETPFVITNDGPVSLYDLRFECVIRRLQVGGITIENHETRTGDAISSLGVGRHITTPGCVNALVKYRDEVASIRRAEISIAVFFSTWLPPWRHEARQGFVAVRDPTNMLRWYPVQ